MEAIQTLSNVFIKPITESSKVQVLLSYHKRSQVLTSEGLPYGAAAPARPEERKARKTWNSDKGQDAAAAVARQTASCHERTARLKFERRAFTGARNTSANLSPNES